MLNNKLLIPHYIILVSKNALRLKRTVVNSGFSKIFFIIYIKLS